MLASFKMTFMVEFADTDMAGIVHFANFFKWMERAEHAFLRSRGLSVSIDIDGQHYGFPRVHVDCDYKRPLRFEEEVEVLVTLERIGSRSLTYKFEFYRADEARDFIASGSISAACVTRDPETKEYRSVSLPAEFLTRLKVDSLPSE